MYVSQGFTSFSQLFIELYDKNERHSFLFFLMFFPAYFLHLHRFCCDLPAKCLIVLHKQGGLRFEQELLDLHPGKHIDKVQRLIPQIKVRRLTTGCVPEPPFFFCPPAEAAQSPSN